MEEENLSLPEQVGWLLHKFDLSVPDLAALLDVHPDTVEWWLKGRPPDLSCVGILLELLHKVPDRIFPLLSLRAEHPAGDGASWPVKIAAARLATGLRKDEFAGFLGTTYESVHRWEEGRTEPRGCYAVVIDLFYAHPREMTELFRLMDQPEPTSPSPWTRKRLFSLMVALGMTTGELAEALGVERQRVTSWMNGRTPPNACTTLFLNLLERFPEQSQKLLRMKVREDWTPERLRAARGDLSAFDLQELTGIDEGSIYRWEGSGLPTKYRCPALFYSILERYPRVFLELAERLQE